MAIHSDYPGVKAEVMVNGQPLREYEDPSDTSEAHTVTKYIEVITNTKFEVKVHIEAGAVSEHEDITMRMSLDGQRAVYYFGRSSRLKRTVTLAQTCKLIDGSLFFYDTQYSELSISKYSSTL